MQQTRLRKHAEHTFETHLSSQRILVDTGLDTTLSGLRSNSTFATGLSLNRRRSRRTSSKQEIEQTVSSLLEYKHRKHGRGVSATFIGETESIVVHVDSMRTMWAVLLPRSGDFSIVEIGPASVNVYEASLLISERCSGEVSMLVLAAGLTQVPHEHGGAHRMGTTFTSAATPFRWLATATFCRTSGSRTLRRRYRTSR